MTGRADDVMRRREFVAALGGAAAAWSLSGSLSAFAQQARKVPTIGFLAFGPVESPELQRLLAAFRQGLRDHDYVEGQNIIIRYRTAEQKIERLPSVAEDLVRMNVDVIVTGSTAAARAAQQATATIPVLCFTMADAVGEGLVASLARPGRNVTGLTILGPELVPKGLELLKEAAPRTARVAALSYPGAYTERTATEMLEGAEAAARKLGMDLRVVSAKPSEDIEIVFSTMVKDRADALIVLPSPHSLFERRRTAALAIQHQLPALFWDRAFVEVGGLLSYGVNFADQFRRGAVYVDKVLKGTKPNDLPVQQPTKFALVINLETAKALGLTVPPSLLARADEVIE
jgi:putative tryptophan/tyrosine transport system substrate-binding protein